jgi:hypothetical protein
MISPLRHAEYFSASPTGCDDTNSVARGIAGPRRPVTVTVPYRPEGTGSAPGGMSRRRLIPRQGDDCRSGEGHTGGMATRTQVFVYQVDASGGTGAWVGTGLLINPLVVLVRPPLSRQLAGQPPTTKLRLGIRSPADHGVIEVIDTRGIQVVVHDGVPLVATGLVRRSKAAVDPILPEGTETDKEDFTEADRKALAQALVTYLSEAAPPDAVAPTARPEAFLLEPSEPEPSEPGERPLCSPWCRIFPRLCKHRCP